jgi:hypothetical protein
MRQGRALLLAAVLGTAFPAFALEEVIDDFTSATNTLNPLVAGPGAGSSGPQTDTGLAGVIGGRRTVEILSDFVTVVQVRGGVDIVTSSFLYSASALSSGRAILTYDGPIKNLGFAEGIRITVLFADVEAGVGGYTINLTLEDSSGPQTVGISRMSSMAEVDIDFDYPFAAFDMIDVADLVKIEVELIGPAAVFSGSDIAFAILSTFNTPTTEIAFCEDGVDNDNDGLIDCQDPDCWGEPPCVAPAPALSGSTMGFAYLMLLATGFIAILRLRRTV